MGTINDKLTYLEETKALLRQTLEDMGATVTDEDTFRRYAEKFANATPDTQYIKDYVCGKSPVITDIIGDFKVDKAHLMICPRIIYPKKSEGNDNEYAIIPYSTRGAFGPYSSAAAGAYLNYDRVKVLSDTMSVRVAINMVKPATLILPEKIDLVQYTLINGYTGTDTSSFSRGLGFGESVYGSVSTWISRTLGTTKRVVKFPPGFRMNDGATLYLSKIYITQDCMKEMVQNLYDYIGTGEATAVTRTISVGATNKALLTADEIQQANDKGWAIT